MRKIRQYNDIDIVVKLRNDEGAVLDADLIKGCKVFLSQLSYRLSIEDYHILPDGGIGFRFHAANQRIGVYSITVTAVTTDGRVFTTDVCNAFALVRCSCDAEDGSSDAEIEALEVDATFKITAWGGGVDEERIKALEKDIEALEKDKQNKIKDLEEIRKGAKLGATALQEYYDDGSHEVVPVKHPDLSSQPSILPYKFAGNYVYEQMVWLNSSDIAVGMKKVDIPTELKPESLMVIDITGCAQSSQGCKTVDVGAAATAEGLFISIVSDISNAKGIWVKIQYCISPNVENNYYYQQTQEKDYIRFLNSLQYGYIVMFHYKTSVAESTSAISVYGGDEFVLEGGMLDDFKNNTMYITLERKDSGSPNVVTLTDGNRKHLWYLGQPLFYSYSSIAGGLTLTQLFDNVERCLITMKKRIV